MPTYQNAIKTGAEPFDPAMKQISSSEPVQIRDLWFYGNLALLARPLAYSVLCIENRSSTPANLETVEANAEQEVLDGKVLVTGVHSDLHQRFAVVPLRWGASRVLVLPSGFRTWLGQRLDQECFPAARLWRHGFDPKCDLVISPYAPDDRVVTRERLDEVDQLIVQIALNGKHHRYE